MKKKFHTLSQKRFSFFFICKVKSQPRKYFIFWQIVPKMAKSQPVLNGVCEGKWRREKKTKDGKIKQYFFLIIDYGCKKQVSK